MMKAEQKALKRFNKGCVDYRLLEDGEHALPEDTEEIQVFYADKNQVRHILKNERVSMRGAYLMMHFLHSDTPFAFLDA